MWKYPEEFFALSTVNDTRNQLLFWNNQHVSNMFEPTVAQSIFESRDPALEDELPVMIATATRSSYSASMFTFVISQPKC